MNCHRSKGLTAVEVLALIVVLGLVLAVLVPWCFDGREPGRRAQCLSNSHQMAIAFKNYEMTTRSLPGWKHNIDKIAVPVSWVPRSCRGCASNRADFAWSSRSS